LSTQTKYLEIEKEHDGVKTVKKKNWFAQRIAGIISLFSGKKNKD